MNEWKSLDVQSQWQILPHVEPLTIMLRENHNLYKQEFQTHHQFLLRRIATDVLTVGLRIWLRDELMYTAPGWMHYQRDTFLVTPALYMGGNSRWIIEVDTGYVSQNTLAVQIALIGERAERISK